MSETRLSLEEVEALARGCLMANGCDHANAEAVAATVTAAERDGAASHGLFRIPGCVAALRSGKINGRAQPKAEGLAPATLRMDGDGGFAPLAHRLSRPLLAERARAGLGGPRHRQHIPFLGALGRSRGPCRRRPGRLRLPCSKPLVAPAGARQAFFGTNPIAFGWPRGDDHPPLVFDQATAVMARGEVMIAARDGHKLPPGVGFGPDGRPTTDPKAVLEGVMLPFGGYKGSAIAMMVELLAAGLIGDGFSFEAARYDNKDGGPPRGGEFMLAIDPARLGDPEGWLDHAEGFFDSLTALDGVRLPGDRRYANRARTPSQGVQVPKALHDKIVALSAS